MRSFVVVTIALAILLTLSCIPTSDQQQVLVSNMAELKTLVKESKVIDQAKADKLFSEAEKVLSQGEQILIAVDGKEGFEMVKSGVEATAGWNPYAGPILLVLNIIQGLGLFGLGKKTIDQGMALQEVVTAVEPNKTPALKTSLTANTSTKTKSLINTIRKAAA